MIVPAPSPAREVAAAIKRRGRATTRQLAEDLDVSYESVRARVAALAEAGLVEASRAEPKSAGRPTAYWHLTRDGEHLFPKAYESLASVLLRVVAQGDDGERLNGVLAALVDAKVASWRPALVDADLDARLDALRSIYSDDDEYISVERDEHGVALVERNCPYLDVAAEHPALCGLTVNTLSQLLRRRVVRTESFQAGDGRCVFRVTDTPVTDPAYVPETADITPQ